MNRSQIRRKKVNSIGLAILLCVNPLSWIFPIDNITVVFALFSLIILVFNNNVRSYYNNKIIIIVAVLLLFLFSYLFAQIDREVFSLYFLSFLAFGLPGLFYSNLDFDIKTFYKTILVIALISIPGIIAISSRNYISLRVATGHWMGVSQGALRLLLGIILVIPFLKKKIFKIFALGIIVFYLNFYFKFGTRGAVLALLIFLFLLFLEKKDLLKPRVFFFTGLCGVLVSVFFIDIIAFMVDILQGVDISLKAFDKMVKLSQAGVELSNGRLGLWAKAFQDILANPVIGNGVTSFNYKYGIYPHDFLIQILHEGGILYFIPMMYPLFKFYKVLISRSFSSMEKQFLIYLFAAGLMELFFSNSYWRNPFFWFFIGYIVNMKPENSVSKISLSSKKNRLYTQY